MTNYKTLDVWIFSMELVKEIYLLTKKYSGDEKYCLTDQTKRAAPSIPCNIAEGMGRNHKRIPYNFFIFQEAQVTKSKPF